MGKYQNALARLKVQHKMQMEEVEELYEERCKDISKLVGLVERMQKFASCAVTCARWGKWDEDCDCGLQAVEEEWRLMVGGYVEKG